jgi:hypothetical protein
MHTLIRYAELVVSIALALAVTIIFIAVLAKVPL